MSKEKEILKSSIWYSIGNIFVKAIAFISLPIFTNLLTTEEYGIFGTYQAYETILSVFISLGVSSTVRAAYNDFRENIERYISAISLQIIVTSLFFILCNLIIYLITSNKIFLIYGFVLILNCMGNALREIFSSLFVIKNQYKKNLLMSLIMSSLNIGISYFLCIFIFSDGKHMGRIIGTVLASCIVALFLFVFQLKKEKRVFWPKAWKFSLSVGIPLIIHQISTSILGQSDKIMIESLIDDSAAGIYAAMLTIILVLQVFMNSLDNAWASWFFNNQPENNIQKSKIIVQSMNKKMVGLFLIIILGFQLLSREVVNIMVSDSYRDGIPVLYILSIDVFINFLYIFSVNVEYFYKKTKLISLNTLIAAAFNIVFNFLGIRFFGYIGAAIATVLSRLLLLSLHSYQAKKLSGFYSLPPINIVGYIIFITSTAYFIYKYESFTYFRFALTFFVGLIGLFYIYTNFIKHKEED